MKLDGNTSNVRGEGSKLSRNWRNTVFARTKYPHTQNPFFASPLVGGLPNPASIKIEQSKERQTSVTAKPCLYHRGWGLPIETFSPRAPAVRTTCGHHWQQPQFHTRLFLLLDRSALPHWSIPVLKVCVSLFSHQPCPLLILLSPVLRTHSKPCRWRVAIKQSKLLSCISFVQSREWAILLFGCSRSSD